MCIGSSNWMAAQYQRLFFNLFNCRSMELSSSFVFISKVSIPRNIANMKSTMLCNCWRFVDEVPSNAMRNLSKLHFSTKTKKKRGEKYIRIHLEFRSLCASASISFFFLENWTNSKQYITIKTQTKWNFYSIANYIQNGSSARQLVMYLSNNTACVLITRTYTTSSKLCQWMNKRKCKRWETQMNSNGYERWQKLVRKQLLHLKKKTHTKSRQKIKTTKYRPTR